MAVQSHLHHQHVSEQTLEQEDRFFFLDALYCEEEQRWEEDEEEEEEEDVSEEDCAQNGRTHSSHLPLLLLEHDMIYDDEELHSLFSKEELQRADYWSSGVGHSVSAVRSEAVQWMLIVNAHYGFSALTAVLAIDYVDRFLSRFLVPEDKPWIIQILSVACISLAAKIEETCVPLLLDLQVGEAKYVFEAKAIQRMELLVLSALRWKMHPVTPLSFLDHVVRRLCLKSQVHWEFFKRCESTLLNVISDSRSVSYLPSVLATATMVHVIEELETSNPVEYKAQLLRVLGMSKEDVEGCWQLIRGISTARIASHGVINSNKRKLDASLMGESSLSNDISDECSCVVGPSSSPPNNHHHHQHHRTRVKRSRGQILDLEKNNQCCSSSSSSCSFSSLGRVFICAVRSPH
ncbi:hypothetical protein SAY87_014403 [Trapa incisa]|uniref:B-like cyclin n=1 Tax=Trapa incisa TaxID=236973 RepID=A0AAN7JKG6_9MYRT|nr:hypothetical protein SAY87_014403 [Trapa incisa]